MSKTESIGLLLLKACASARKQLVVCAPFIKAAVIERAMQATNEEVEIEVFTRWRPDEIAANVSDTRVLSLVANRGGSVYLCDRLHAKYIRFDERALIGSANLTSAALGWSASPNLELLIEVLADHPALVVLENSLRRESVIATEAIADEVERVAALLPSRILEEPDLLVEHAPSPIWYPHLREPLDLFIAYLKGPDYLSRASATAATLDLAALEVPIGFDRATFETLVGTRLLQATVVQRINSLLTEPQRFGAVRDELVKLLDIDREQATYVWQTLMRWQLHFLPYHYSRIVPSHTEVLFRPTNGSESL